MEPNQPFKKRIVESPTQSDNDCLRQPPHQFYQYVPVPEDAQNEQNTEEQSSAEDLRRRQDRTVRVAPRLLHFLNYEPPMTLNCWTQTENDEFPPREDLEAELQDLRQRLQKQIELTAEARKQNNNRSSPDPLNRDELVAEVQDLRQRLQKQIELTAEARSQVNKTTSAEAEDLEAVLQDLRQRLQKQIELTAEARRQAEDPRREELQAELQDLRQRLQIQIELNNEARRQNVSPSVSQEDLQSPKRTPGVVKHEARTYTILAHSTDDNTDQIEIELAENSIAENHAQISVYDISPNKTEPASEGIPMTPSTSSVTRIGPNGTMVPSTEFSKINWGSASIATRKLLTIIFDRETLATHSMTGKASPAFKDQDKPVKGRLDPNAIQDIIHAVSTNCRVSAKEVRSAITTKCADENKMLKMKCLKKQAVQTPRRSALSEINKQGSAGKENTSF